MNYGHQVILSSLPILEGMYAPYAHLWNPPLEHIHVILCHGKMALNTGTLFLCLMICSTSVRCQTGSFVPLGSRYQCPLSADKWKESSDNKNCQSGSSYHCVPNQHGDFGEVCVNRTWVQPGMCLDILIFIAGKISLSDKITNIFILKQNLYIW